MSGTLGEAVMVLEPDGMTRAGERRWRLMLATPKRDPDPDGRARNRRGAAWRIERRKAEGVETLGGQD